MYMRNRREKIIIKKDVDMCINKDIYNDGTIFT